ncbi:hypothetical protein ACE6H2_000951 [Prunus campanulata]
MEGDFQFGSISNSLDLLSEVAVVVKDWEEEDVEKAMAMTVRSYCNPLQGFGFDCYKQSIDGVEKSQHVQWHMHSLSPKLDGGIMRIARKSFSPPHIGTFLPWYLMDWDGIMRIIWQKQPSCQLILMIPSQSIRGRKCPI